jgi:stage V sporulation protein D (sporulation-specific penicillin-binding protein)
MKDVVSSKKKSLIKKKSKFNFHIHEEKIRYGIIFLLLIVPFLYLIYTLFDLQILKRKDYIKKRDEQLSYIPEATNNRGRIYAQRKDGELVVLAGMKEWYKLAVLPKEIPEEYEKRAYERLNEIIPLDEEIFLKKVSKKNDPYEELFDVSPEIARKVEELNIVGVKTYKYALREYPFEFVGAKVIGFVGDGDGGMKGRYGLEKYYDDVLQKDVSKSSYFLVNIFNALKGKTSLNMESGNEDLITTLEPNVMKYFYNFLGDLQKEWQADTVAGIVFKPQTGEILAMDSLPTFDPNSYKDFPNSNFINPLVQGVYEMGSIVKPLTMALGIDANLITPETYFRDTGSVFIDGYTIKNFDGKVRGDVTMQTVLGQSLNTGVIYVMRLLGMNNFRDGFIKLGIEEETGIDLPGEISNKTKNLHSKTEVNYATASFGQGIAITPISIARTLSILINDGKKITPYLVEYRSQKDNQKINISPEKDFPQVLNKETSETVKEMMIKIIDEDLGNGKWSDKNYKVGAKTGTAQLTKETGGYYNDKFLHSYFTFFGQGDEQIAILVFQVNPKRGTLASLVLTPSVNKLKNFLITYYQIKPDR